MSVQPNPLPAVFVSRAEFGKYAKAFVTNGYIGIGWFEQHDLSDARERGHDYLGELHDLYEPDASPNRKWVNVGQG